MKKWTEEMDRVLMERYADEESGVLAEELGVGLRTIQRRAARFGLRKSEELLSRIGKKGSDEAVRKLRMSGEKRRLSRAGGRPFRKGHKWDPETEQKRLGAVKEGWMKRSARLGAEKKPKSYLEKSIRMRKFAENMRKDDLRKMSVEELEHLWRKKVDEVMMIRQEIDRRKENGVQLRDGRDVNFEEYVTK